MKVRVIDADWFQLLRVLDDIRPADRREWFAGSGKPFSEAAKATLEGGAYARVALDADGLPLCFWGCDDGYVWLFATQHAETVALSLHRVLKPNLKDLLDRWPKLHAWADARNELHHVWLRWLGFTEEREDFIEPFGLPFKLFTLEAAQCASKQ